MNTAKQLIKPAKLPIDDPAAVDSLLIAPHKLLKSAFGTTPLGRARWGQVLLARGTMRDAQKIGAQVQGSELERGLSLLAQVQLKLYEEVAGAEAEPTGRAPLQLEDSCHAHFAVGMAAAELGRHHKAITHICSAITLAHALGLQNRLQTLEIELCRIENLAGNGDAERLRQVLISVLSPRTELWGRRVLAETLMSWGKYSDALIALGTPEEDGIREASLRELLHRLLDLPPARMGDPLLKKNDSYYMLAQGLEALFERKKLPPLEYISNEPERTYARIIEAIALVRNPRLAASSSLSLRATPPMRLDQRIYWGIVRLSAFTEGAPDIDPLIATEVLRDAVERMHSSGEVIRLIKSLAPDRYMLLLLGPTADIIQPLGLPDVAVLQGSNIIRGGEKARMPGRTGRTLVLEAARFHDRDDLYSYEHKRAEEVFSKFGGIHQVANLGWVLRAVYRVWQHAVKAGDEAAAKRWQTAYARVWAILSKDVKEALVGYSPERLE